MKKINLDQIQRDIDSRQLKESEPLQKSEQIDIKHFNMMDRLWIRLSEIYGHQLVSQYGETIPESWDQLLTGLSGEQIKAGLDNLVDRKDTWPPNAQEFRQLCLPKTISPDGTNSGAYIQFKPDSRIESDEHKDKRKQAGRKALNEMLKGL